MGKVDCITEAIENAKKDKSIEIARNLLELEKLSLEEISKCTRLPLDEVRNLNNNFHTFFIK